MEAGLTIKPTRAPSSEAAFESRSTSNPDFIGIQIFFGKLREKPPGHKGTRTYRGYGSLRPASPWNDRVSCMLPEPPLTQAIFLLPSEQSSFTRRGPSR